MNGTRREFLKKSAMGSALLSMGLLNGCESGPDRIRKLGLITGVIRDQLKEDYKATLTRVAEIGYDYLEFGNYMGPSLEEFKRFLQDIGLQPLAGGSSMARMIREDDLKKLVDEALALGKKYMVCYWPWLDSGEDKDADDFMAAAARLNELGRECNKMGIRFAFHNHDKEFVPMENYHWGYEILLRETDRELVTMQLDLYWAIKGGADPLVLFEEYPGRYDLFHVKDMEDSAEKLYTCPGYGTIDFKSIFARAEQAGVKYYIVEIDKHSQPMQCIEDSYKYLTGLRF